MSVRITDDNRIPELVQQLKSLSNRKVQLGIDAPSGDILYTVAWVHEFGINIKVTDNMRGFFLGQGMPLKKSTTHIQIPERSYFRSGFDSNENAISLKAEELVGQLLDGNISAYQARNDLGEFASEKISDNVTSVGLVKTGDLRDAIGFRVVRK